MWVHQRWRIGMLLWKCGGLKLLTAARSIKWEYNTELMRWEHGKKTTCFHWTSVFWKVIFLGDGLFLWQPSLLFLLNNYSGKNDFKSNTTLVIKVWCTSMKWYLIEYLIKTKLFPQQIAFSIGLRATSDKMTVPTSLEMEMHSPLLRGSGISHIILLGNHFISTPNKLVCRITAVT